MMISLLENPEFMRHFRSHTRKGRAATPHVVFLAACGVCLAVNLLLYYRRQAFDSFPACFQSIFFQIIGANFFLLLGLGGHACGESVTAERQANTLEFQRITGMNPYTLALGKILGVPIVYYYLAILGLPVTMLSVACGGLTLPGYLTTYLLLIVFGLSYCSASTLASALRRGKTGQRTSPAVLLIILVSFVPTLLFGGFRAPGFGFSSSPGLWACLLPFHALGAVGQGRLESFQVSLFGLSINGVLMTLIMNGLLFLAGWAGTARRLQSDSQALWTKPQLLGGSAVILILLGSHVSEAMTSSANPWLPLAAGAIAAHVLLMIVAAAASPGLYCFRLGLRRGTSRAPWRSALLDEKMMAFPLVLLLSVASVGLLAAIALTKGPGLTLGTSWFPLVCILAPLVVCGMTYTTGAQFCRLVAPDHGLKLYIGGMFLWVVVPVIGGLLLRAWNVAASGASGGPAFLLLSPLGICVSTIGDEAMTVPPMLFWGALLAWSAATGWLWWYLARFRSVLQRRCASPPS